MQGALTSARFCSVRVFANAEAGESDAALSAPFQPGKPQEWRSHAECRQAACVSLLEPAHFCVLGETHSKPTHSTPLQQTASTTEYDANAAARKTVRSGAVCDLDAQERRREGVECAGRLREELGEGPVTGIEGRLAYRFAKRAFDVAFSAAVLVAFCWLFAIIAVLIKADDPKGPVLFKQRRVGKGGQTFQMYKFRSMCVDAEERLAELRELNEKTGPVFKMAEDPRVTRVGKITRKLSIDELPQFANVLKGDIPLRILKTRSEFSEKSMGAFALPAKFSTNENTAFSQVNVAAAVNLRTRRIANPHSNLARSAEPAIFAKPIFGAVAA